MSTRNKLANLTPEALNKAKIANVLHPRALQLKQGILSLCCQSLLTRGGCNHGKNAILSP